MKNWRILFWVALLPSLTACYDDYIHDYDYSTMYVPHQIDVRTFVVGEGMRFKFGVELGGVRSNTVTRNATFKLDPSLITASKLIDMQNSSYPYIKNEMLLTDTLRLLPPSMYTLSNAETISILPGNHTGTIEIKADSAAFLQDVSTRNARYAIPFSLVSVDADRMLEHKSNAVIAVKYENMLFGNYLHGGVTTVKSPTGNVVKTTVYRTSVSQGPTEIWNLVTSSPNSLVVRGYSNVTSAKPEIKLTLSGNNIDVASADGATFAFESDGESRFNGVRNLQERRIFLNYKYVDADGNTCSAQDTLTFRNRIRDGVNEWQGYGQ
jgi:hypothetical protein